MSHGMANATLVRFLRRLATFAVLLLAARWDLHASRLLRGPEPYSLPLSPSAVLAADLSGDGIPDLVVAHASGSFVTVMLGTGAGLGQPRTYPSGVGPSALATGDFDLDGSPDLLVLGAAVPSATVLINAGDGSFEAHVSIALDFAPEAAELGDIDGDGLLDAVVTGRATATSFGVLLGDGGGGFRRKLRSPVARAVLAAGLSDRDGDARLDLELVERPGEARPLIVVERLRGAGDGSFELLSSVEKDLPDPPGRAVRGDLDGDGAGDLGIVTAGGAVVLLRGLPGGGLETGPVVPAREGEAPGSFVEVRDFTGDGEVDLVATFERRGVEILRVHPGGPGNDFANPTEATLGRAGISALGLADLDRDGLLDAFLGWEDLRMLALLRGRTPAGVCGGEVIRIAEGADEVLALDWSGDRTPDLVVRGGYALGALRGDGGGGYEELLASALPVLEGPVAGGGRLPLFYRRLIALDYDGDGRPDAGAIATAERPQLAQLARGKVALAFLGPDGALEASTELELNEQPGAMATADFDGDGLSDLAVTDTASSAVTVLFGSSTRFGRIARVDLGAEQTAIDAGDVDGDGLADMALATSAGAAILLGDGTGSFPRTIALESLGDSSALRLADLDGDGKMDLAGLQSNSLTILRKVTESGDSARESVAVGSEARGLRVADIDGDRRGEILLIEGKPARLSLYRLDPGGGAAAKEIYFAGWDPMAFEVTDLDGDGVIDCAIADAGSKSLLVYQGAGPAEPARFRRGDADGDGRVTISDPIRVLGRLFLGGEPLACEDAADSDDDGALNLTDPIAVLRYLFQGGEPPRAPGPEKCGADPTEDDLPACASTCP
jgi:hypothetical protein